MLKLHQCYLTGTIVMGTKCPVFQSYVLYGQCLSPVSFLQSPDSGCDEWMAAILNSSLLECFNANKTL